MGNLHKIRQAYNKLPLQEKQRIKHQKIGCYLDNGSVVFPDNFICRSYRNFVKSLGEVGLSDNAEVNVGE